MINRGRLDASDTVPMKDLIGQLRAIADWIESDEIQSVVSFRINTYDSNIVTHEDSGEIKIGNKLLTVEADLELPHE